MRHLCHVDRWVISITLSFTTLVSIVTAQTQKLDSPREVADDEVKLEPFEVTGSRLKRFANAGPTPTFDMTLPEIESAGFARVENYLQQLPFNVGTTQDTTSPTTFQPGITSINLRGLGYAAGLPLVNGRRLPLFGQAGAAQLGYDMGSIPMAALDRVEIAKDGASAIYGSDAVAGVVNYRLRTDFSGTELRSSYRQMEESDWSFWSASILHGGKRGALRYVVAIDHDDNNSVLFSDRPISASEDFRSIGGYDIRAPQTFPAQLVVPVGTPGVPANLTGRLIVPGTLNASGEASIQTTSAPQLSQFIAFPPNFVNGKPAPGDSRNGLDRAPYSTMVPNLHNTGAWSYLEYTFSDRLEAFVDASYRHRIVGTTYEPSTISLVGERGFGDLPDGAIVFPAANPYNPFGVDIRDMAFYLPEMGARDNEITVQVPRIVAGLRGKFGESWDWEIAGSHARSRVYSRWTRFLSDQALQDGLAGRLGGWLNPFGPSDPGVVERMRTDLHDLQIAAVSMFDYRLRGQWGRLPGGPIQTVVGGELREETFEHRPHILRATGGLVSLARRPPRDLAKDVVSSYVETSLPITKKLEITAAARWEHYRDFGDPVKPKFGARWEILPGLALRGTRSEAFHAPELLQAYTDSQETFTQLPDPKRTDLGIYTMRVLNGGNPDLKPEETIVTYLGVTFEPKWLPGLSLSADHWLYDQTNLIGTIGAQNLLRNEATVAPGRIVRGPSPGNGIPGEVIVINDTFGNFDRYSTSGWDFEAAYAFATGSNHWRFATNVVNLRSAARQALGFGPDERVKQYAHAAWRLNAIATWRRGDFDATVHYNWIARQGGAPPLLDLPFGQAAKSIVNVSFGFPGFHETEWRIGANNVTDEAPPRNYYSRTGYTNGYYDAQGRTWFASVTRRF